MNEKNATLIVGASSNPARYSYIATRMLLERKHEVELLGLREDVVFDKKIDKERKDYKNIDTIGLYIGPPRQVELYDYLIGLKPRRVIFNPGTENPEFMNLLRQEGIEVEAACMLVMMSVGTY